MGECLNGHEVPEGQKFCGQCGAAVAEAPAPTGAAAPSVPTAMADDITPAAATPRRSRRGLLLAGLGVLALVVAVAAVAVRGGNKQEIKGRFTLIDSDVTGTSDSCEGTGGYDDVDAGMPVTVRNQKGEIVGGSATRHGTRDELVERMLEDGKHGGEFASKVEAEDALDSEFVCMLLFDVKVDDASFYEVEVGRRGKISYSKTDLKRRGWVVSLSLS